MEEGGTLEGKMGEGEQEEEKWNKKRRSGKSINLLVRLVTEFLTKHCMIAYECNVRHCAHVYNSSSELTS